MDHLGFVKAIDGLGERFVVAVADAADRGLNACLGKPLGILDGEVLHTTIAVVDEAAAANRPSLMQRLLQRIQHEAGVSRAGAGGETRQPTMRRAKASMTKAT